MSLASLNKIERAHQMYREGRYEEALGFYTEALSMAKTNAQKIALHSNRAACYLKLHRFKKAAEECTSVLELDHKHTGALMLRAQTLVTLKDYHSALFDVNQLIELNPSSEVYRNLQARLRTQLSLATIPESEAELEEEEEQVAEPCRIGEDEGLVDNTEDTVIGSNLNVADDGTSMNAEVIVPEVPSVKEYLGHEINQQHVPQRIYGAVASQEQSINDSKGWQAIPKPKGHSALDYARWDRVEDHSSEDDDDDEDECQPQYRFRVRTIGVRPVK